MANTFARSFFMPLRGAIAVLCRPEMLFQLALPFIVSTVVLIALLFSLFYWTLGPQEDLLEHWGVRPSFVRWFTVVLLVLAEAAIASLIIFLVFFGNVQTAITTMALKELGVPKQP